MMDKNRCLFCGEFNPVDAEKCSICGMPLISDDVSLSGDMDDIIMQSEQDLPDDEKTPDRESVGQDTGGEDEQPDWLNGLRKQTAGTREFRNEDGQQAASEGEAFSDLESSIWYRDVLSAEESSLEDLKQEESIDPQSLTSADEATEEELSEKESDQILAWLDDSEVENIDLDDFAKDIQPELEHPEFSTTPFTPEILGEHTPADQITSPVHETEGSLDRLEESQNEDGNASESGSFEDLRQSFIEGTQIEAEEFEGESAELNYDLAQLAGDLDFSPVDLSWVGKDDFDAGTDSTASESDPLQNHIPLSLENTQGGTDAPSEGGFEGSTNFEIPEWLKSMSPFGSRGEDEPGNIRSGSYVEKAGPLAGLVDAIPAEPDVVSSAKSSPLSPRLQITKLQKTHARLLAEMIDGGEHNQHDAQKQAPDKRMVARIIIALLLFATVLFSSYLGWAPQKPSPSVGVEAFMAKKLVDDLPESSYVFVAIDYSPGYTAELEIEAEILARHLLDQGHHLMFVSTNPLGPILAGRVMDRLKKVSPAYSDPSYTILGFIPGGAVGIRSFAQNPPGMFPRDIDGQPVWDAPGLMNQKTLSDFPLLAVITENPERFREWIEQARPLMNDSKLLMIVSAQNEPVVRAFIDPNLRKVDGLVSSLGGSAEYAILMGDYSILSDLWSPHAYAATAAFGLIIVLGIMNTIARRLKSDQNDEAQK